MITTLPSTEAYPKTKLLRDNTQVVLRPMVAEDKISLLYSSKRIPEEERCYLNENVASPEVIQTRTTDIDFSRVVPIVAVVSVEIIADATFHRSWAMARRHVGELRVVVYSLYWGVGLGR